MNHHIDDEQAARVAFVRGKIASPAGAIQVIALAYSMTPAVAILDSRPSPTATAMRDVERATDSPTERHMGIVLALQVLADCDAVANSVCRALDQGQVNIDRRFYLGAAYLAHLARLGHRLVGAERELVNAATQLEQVDQ